MNKVAIITRTKNRPLTLNRVLGNLQQQIFQDFVWVVVNDGGEKEAVNRITEQAVAININTIVIHNPLSLGMEAASNLGIKNSKSKYIVILDDDDTWEARFLAATVAFLEDKDNALYKGVVTRTMMLEEEIEDKQITFKKSYPFDAELENITILRVARCKTFANLSFLYYREAIDKIGLYREDYPIIGDWDFSLRFVRHYNIAVIPEYLANYHIRKSHTKSDYANSVANKLREKKYLSLIRDELLRNDLDSGKMGIGYLVNLGDEINKLEKSINHGSFIWVIRKIYSKIKQKLS